MGGDLIPDLAQSLSGEVIPTTCLNLTEWPKVIPLVIDLIQSDQVKMQ